MFARMDAASSLVVVGGGTAGAELAFAARQYGWAGTITLFCAERHLPYHRPPLSKNYLTRKAAADTLPLRPATAYEQARIELVLGAEIVSIAPGDHRVVLADQSERAYSKLALCLGGRARPLAFAGLEHATPKNLLSLRDRDDAVAIGERLRPGAKLVVVGGGYVGLEVAASARALGAEVTVLEARERVLARVMGRELSAFFEQAHRDAGVDIRTNVHDVNMRLAQDGAISTVIADGEELAADLVVVGAGMIANTEIAKAAGLLVRTGIIVDEHARTSDEDIYAAGDCTELPGGRLYERPIRLESVANATEQARAAAFALCGKPKPYHPVPWFWSDQYDLKLQSVGLADGHDAFVLRGNSAAKSFSGFYLKSGILIAADSINRPGDFIVAKRLIAAQTPVSVDRLADEQTPLKDLLT